MSNNARMHGIWLHTHGTLDSPRWARRAPLLEVGISIYGSGYTRYLAVHPVHGVTVSGPKVYRGP